MSKVDWSLAPEGATHYSPACEDYNACWCKFVSGKLYGWLKDGDTQWDHLPSQQTNQDKMDDLIERPKQPQAWSGPEDGLPPVNTECEVETDFGVWEHGVILCHGYDDFKPHAVAQCASGLWMEEVNGFRAIKTPEQIARDKRESAIRELMDIAQVDCRVTAARLVDAGFKR